MKPAFAGLCDGDTLRGQGQVRGQQQVLGREPADVNLNCEVIQPSDNSATRRESESREGQRGRRGQPKLRECP